MGSGLFAMEDIEKDECVIGVLKNGILWYPEPWMYPKNYLMKNDYS
jgi:hypothetical protein